MTGLKSDYTTKLALPFVSHSSSESADERARDEVRAHEASDKLRTLFLKHVMPKVDKYFSSLFKHVRDWQEAFDVRMFAGFTNAVGAAACY